MENVDKYSFCSEDDGIRKSMCHFPFFEKYIYIFFLFPVLFSVYRLIFNMTFFIEATREVIVRDANNEFNNKKRMEKKQAELRKKMCHGNRKHLIALR